MKRIAALFLIMALFVAGACAFAEGAMPAAPGAFLEPSNEFSMATAFHVLSSFVQQGANAARAAFEEQNFEVLRQEHYDKDISDHSHTSAYTLAAGKMDIRGESRNVAVISVRGTGDGEWYSNFDFAGESRGQCLYAENFMAAAQDIFAGIKADIDAMDEPVIIATGYSRGAACANLLGMLLDEAYGMDDVYVYTFATPNTVRGEVAGYENIFNLVNMNDMVTRMPMSVWGFSRAGVDIELRQSGYVNTDMHNMFLALLGICGDIDSYYEDRHSITGSGLSGDGLTTFEVFQLVAGNLTSDEETAAQARQQLSAVMANENDFTKVLTFFAGEGESGEADMMGIFGQHMPDVYAKLMMELSGY
jgi:hypothetical protein